MKEEKIRLLNQQLKGSAVFLLTIIISMLYTYDVKLDFEDKERLFSDEEAQKIIVFNRVLILLVGIFFIYINIEDYNYVIKYNKTDQIEGSKLQIDASILTTIAAAIILYVVLTGSSYPLSITSTENS